MRWPAWLRGWSGGAAGPPPELLQARAAEAAQMEAARELARRARATADALRYESGIRRAYQGDG